MSLKLPVYALAQHGQVLATRPDGREVAVKVGEFFRQQPGLVLGLHNVEVATPSFLDEVVRVLRAQLLADEGKFLLAAGMNEDVKESLELILVRHKMAMGVLEGEQLELLNGSQQLQETLREAERLGTFTAPQLAEQLEIKLPALHQRLSALTGSGVVAREGDGGSGRGRRGTYHAVQGLPDIEALTPA